MQSAVKHFAHKVLAIHLLLLLVVLVFVFLAVQEVYQSARAHALDQAIKRQTLLAQETARGVQSYYESILTDLQLLRPLNPDDPDGGYASPRAPETQPNPAMARAAAGLLGPLLGRQLEGRLSHLFTVDRQSLRLRWTSIGRDEQSPSIADMLTRASPWLRSLKQPAMSDFILFGDRGFHLVAIPVGGAARPLILVAVVPVRRIEHWFLDELSEGGVTASFLVNDSLQILNSRRRELVGQRLSAAGDARLRGAVESLAAGGFHGTTVLPSGFRVGADAFAPSLISVDPVRVSDKHWFVLLASNLADVDAVVRQIFRRALFWAIFLAGSITAILVSTAVQLIRNRARLEQMRHDLLDREVKEARKIQLAWLPQSPPRSTALDLAPANEPASHISGDFYNWFDLPDGRTAIAIGDVTGHGMSAAFLMATTQLLVRTTLPGLCDPGQCLRQVNEQLCVQAFNGQFVTMLLLIVDPRSGVVQFCSAGHPPPILCTAAAARSLPADSDIVLGVDPDAAYITHSLTLGEQEHLLLYTDGLTESENPAGDRFGLPRLLKCLTPARQSAREMVDTILNEASTFRRGRSGADDLTLLAIRVTPRPAADPENPPQLKPSRPHRGLDSEASEIHVPSAAGREP